MIRQQRNMLLAFAAGAVLADCALWGATALSDAYARGFAFPVSAFIALAACQIASLALGCRVSPPRAAQFVWMNAAVLLLSVGMAMQAPLTRQSEKYELAPPGSAVMARYPEMAILQMVPGGLRAPMIHYMWIRAENLKQINQYHDAMQLSDMICSLMPRFPGVWGYHAWNMAWNISVQTHTPDERWMWVNHGVELLRDRGIPLNPHALSLYKDLGWIYFSKMGMTLDDMHMVYKKRWAAQMQHLLGSPPVGDTQDALDAFEPTTQAPLDKNPDSQGKDLIQKDQLAKLLGVPLDKLDVVLSDKPLPPDAAATLLVTPEAKYANALAQLDVRVDSPDFSYVRPSVGDMTLGLLQAYNAYSQDESILSTRRDWFRSFDLDHPRDAKIQEAINDPQYADRNVPIDPEHPEKTRRELRARTKLLAFVCAQLLWNQYKMDPDWMFALMRKYGPLDWRFVQCAGLYWVTYGIHVCNSQDLKDIDSTNSNRIQLWPKDLTWFGRMYYSENPMAPEDPGLDFLSDWRFCKPYLQEAEADARATLPPGADFADNLYSSGHVNYIIQMIEMLYLNYRWQEAQDMLDYCHNVYKRHGPEWDMPVKEFVEYHYKKDGKPTQEVAITLITGTMVTSLDFLAHGNQKVSKQFLGEADAIYKTWTADLPERIAHDAFEGMYAKSAVDLLVRPEMRSRKLSLVERSQLYARLDLRTQQTIYDAIAPFLRAQCAAAPPKDRVKFDNAFPEPPGMDQVRRERQQRFLPPPPKPQ